MALLPLNEVPHLFNLWDKAQHVLAFTVLAMTGRLAFTRLSRSLFLGLVVYGASLEVMQTMCTSTRFGEWSDLMADSVGIALGFTLLRLTTQYRTILKL